MAAPTIPYTIPGTVGSVRPWPEIVARVAFNGASDHDGTPLVWVDVSDRLRSFSISRGGENELELLDTGTCTVVLDNRNRDLDPFNTSSSYAPNVLPMRRLWLQAQWDGVTYDLFYGWTGAWQPSWHASDAVVTVTGRDGFAIAAGDALPTSSPPRDSYGEVVLSDKPTAYWKLDEEDVSEGNEFADSSENSFTAIWSNARPTPGQTGLIVGEADTSTRFTLAGGAQIWAPKGDAAEDTVGNYEGKQRMSAEAWVRFTSTPAASQGFLRGPIADNGVMSGPMFNLMVSATGEFTALVLPSSGSSVVATGAAGAAVAGTIYHLVMTWVSGTAGGGSSLLSLYVNNVLVDTTAGPAGAGVALAPYDTFRTNIGWNGLNTCNADLQHVALYPSTLSATRIAAHYAAGTSMGHNEDTTDRHIAVALEETGLHFVPRRLRTGQRDIQPVYFRGQPPKEWFEDAVRTEGDPAMFFFARDGAAVFLDRDHRTVSPWNTIQATFDDDGVDLTYLDGSLEIDDGEAFIYNDVRGVAAGGPGAQLQDLASIAAYQRRVLDLGETLNASDADVVSEVAARLVKYKNPLPRITGFALSGGQDIDHPGVLAQMLAREIGDRVRIRANLTAFPGVDLDQTVFIRKISLSGSAGDPYLTVQWSLAQR